MGIESFLKWAANYGIQEVDEAIKNCKVATLSFMCNYLEEKTRVHKLKREI